MRPARIPGSNFFTRWRALVLGAALLSLASPSARCALDWERKITEVTVSPGQRNVVARFPFKNTGSHTVKIRGMTSSCGCTTADLEKREYAPGESGAVTLVFTIGDRTGLQQKGVTVETDEPGGIGQTLVLRALIQETVEFSRSVLVWAKGEPAKPIAVEAHILGERPIHLVSATSNNPAFRVTLEAVGGPRRYRITVTPAATASREKGIILVTADDPPESPQVFRLIATVK